jgi:hypothetical protein
LRGFLGEFGKSRSERSQAFGNQARQNRNVLQGAAKVARRNRLISQQDMSRRVPRVAAERSPQQSRAAPFPPCGQGAGAGHQEGRGSERTALADFRESSQCEAVGLFSLAGGSADPGQPLLYHPVRMVRP